MTKYILILFLLVAMPAQAATEFVSAINKTGEDYDTLTLWEAAMDNAGDITASDVKVFAHGGITGTVGDGASVTGQTSSATGTVIHASTTQILIDAISGTFSSGEEVRVTAGNSVTISDAGDSPIITAELYDDDGEFDDKVTINGLTTDATNYMKITVPEAERRQGLYGFGDSGTGFSWGPSGTGRTIYILDDNVTVEHVTIVGANGAGSGSGIIQTNNANTTLNNVMLRDWTGTSSYGVSVITSLASVKMTNCLIFGGIDRGVSVGASGTSEIYNSTFFHLGARSVYSADAGTIVQNNIVTDNNQFNDYCCSFDSSSNNNISEDGTAPGADLDSGTTDSSGNTGTTVVDAGQNFTTTVSPTLDAGDPVWFNNDTLDTTSRIASVTNDTTLELEDSGVTGNSDAFSINESAYYIPSSAIWVADDYGLEDFNLLSTATAVDGGIDLSSDFTDDIEGTTRDAVFDIGAYEFVADLATTHHQAITVY